MCARPRWHDVFPTGPVSGQNIANSRIYRPAKRRAHLARGYPTSEQPGYEHVEDIFWSYTLEIQRYRYPHDGSYWYLLLYQLPVFDLGATRDMRALDPQAS